jgi:hypothetical protein
MIPMIDSELTGDSRCDKKFLSFENEKKEVRHGDEE